MYKIDKLFFSESFKQFAIRFSNGIPSHVRHFIFMFLRNKTLHVHIKDIQTIDLSFFGIPAHQLHTETNSKYRLTEIFYQFVQSRCFQVVHGSFRLSHSGEVAKEFEANGVRRLHVVDLDGAASHHVVNYRVLERIAAHTSLVIDFGGGVKSDEDLKIAFESGAQMVTGGSIAVKDPELFCHWLEVYGSEKIILGADVKDHKIAVNGWKDESSCELFPFLENYMDKGIRKVICTDISCDGMLSGPSIDLYKEMLAKFPDLYLMASGGVSKVDDIVALDEAGVPGVIFGKALYEGHITLKDLRIFL